VLRAARREPRALVIGVDADASSVREAARRAAKPAAKGGLPNAIFLVGDARTALGLLVGRVDELRIVLPWGSLLHWVLEGERSFALAVAGAL